jgi:hypothetical protein
MFEIYQKLLNTRKGLFKPLILCINTSSNQINEIIQSQVFDYMKCTITVWERLTNPQQCIFTEHSNKLSSL